MAQFTRTPDGGYQFNVGRYTYRAVRNEAGFSGRDWDLLRVNDKTPDARGFVQGDSWVADQLTGRAECVEVAARDAAVQLGYGTHARVFADGYRRDRATMPEFPGPARSAWQAGWVAAQTRVNGKPKPRMTGRDYELIARVLRETRPERVTDPGLVSGYNPAGVTMDYSTRLAQWLDTRDAFTRELAETSDTFDRARFVQATTE